MTTFSGNLQRQADELKEQLAAVEAEIRRQDGLPEVERLAEHIHKKMCHFEHTEACGWYYEDNDWTKWAHARYLEQAKKVLTVADYKQAVDLIDVLAGF